MKREKIYQDFDCKAVRMHVYLLNWRIDMKNRGKVIFITMCSLLLLSGCAYRVSETENTVEGRTNEASETEDALELWGSFTADKIYSYDEKYFAIQEVEYINDVNYIKVCIYETETDELVSYFYSARSRDFWGICWENDSYNIWTQSGDIGTYCYKYEDMQWKRDESAQRPEYIISKYD